MISRARHKNLLRLLGYYVEGDYRVLVYEYVDKGKLNQWFHEDVGVIGGSGYVASWLVKFLLHRGYIVCAIVRDPTDPKRAGHPLALEGASTWNTSNAVSLMFPKER